MPVVDPPHDLCCAITADLFIDPVITTDGHSYSRAAIEEWFTTCDDQRRPITSPKTNQSLASRALKSNSELQMRVTAYRQSILSIDAFRSAICTGDLKTLKSAKILRSALTVPLTETDPPLFVAVGCGHVRVVRWLLASGADVRARSAHDRTCLHVAAERAAAADILTTLIEAKADVNAVMDDGRTSLHVAAQHSPSLIPVLLATGKADPNAFTLIDRCTPLHFVNCDTAAVRHLIAAGADPFATGSGHHTVLHYAIERYGRSVPPKQLIAFVEEMIAVMTRAGGRDKTRTTIAAHTTPLIHSAAVRSDISVVIHLLSLRELALAVTDRAPNGDTIFHAIVQSTSTDLTAIRALIDLVFASGGAAVVDATDQYGETALYLACGRLIELEDSKISTLERDCLRHVLSALIARGTIPPLPCPLFGCGALRFCVVVCVVFCRCQTPVRRKTGCILRSVHHRFIRCWFFRTSQQTRSDERRLRRFESTDQEVATQSDDTRSSYKWCDTHVATSTTTTTTNRNKNELILFECGWTDLFYVDSYFLFIGLFQPQLS